jgi:succinate dehydrogenase/fumarate reductase flavoprotein subunit
MAAPPSNSEASDQTGGHVHEVMVVGAGLAGVGAAIALQQSALRRSRAAEFDVTHTSPQANP